MTDRLRDAIRDYAVALDESAPTLDDLLPRRAVGEERATAAVEIGIVGESHGTVRGSRRRWMAVAAAVVALALAPLSVWLVADRAHDEGAADLPPDISLAAPEREATGTLPATTGVITVTVDTVLAADHEGHIVVGADDITLDCGGHTITGTEPESSNPRGIVLSNRSGVTVRGCRLVEAEFLIENTRDSVFASNETDGRGAGFDLVDAHDNRFTENDITGGNSVGLNGSTGNIFEGNTVSDAGVGFNVFLGSVGNTFTDNVLRGNAQGIADDSSGGSGTAGTANVYVGNECVENGIASIPTGLCE